MRPCFCDKVACCRLCFLYRSHADYRRLWDGAPAMSAARDRPCRYLGDDTGDRRRCATCRGHVSLKVYVCRHADHGDRPTTTRPDCLRCVDYSPNDVEAKP